MPEYEYSCPAHGRQLVAKPMAAAGWEEWCPACLSDACRQLQATPELVRCSPHGPMRRIYATPSVISRPRGYNLRPGEYAGNGLGYSFFDYEMERGELKDDATGAYTPESRAKREAAIAATDVYVPRSPAEIDADIPERAHQELHEWARAVHSQVSEGA